MPTKRMKDDAGVRYLFHALDGHFFRDQRCWVHRAEQYIVLYWHHAETVVKGYSYSKSICFTKVHSLGRKSGIVKNIMVAYHHCYQIKQTGKS